MYLEKLKIINFRNYSQLDLDFEKNTILITGDNGKGKTNLLESIYYISAGRSHRTNKPEELINWKDSSAIIRASISERAETEYADSKKQKKHLIEIELSRNNNIKIRIDRVPYKKKSDFVSILPSVIFSPDDLMIIKGSPSNRRGFLDSIIEKIQKDYQDLCIKYQKILNQRNSLLKSIVNADQAASNTTLETWDENLAKYGSEIILRRYQLIAEIKSSFSELMNRFFPDISTKIFYVFSWERKNSFSYPSSSKPENTMKMPGGGSLDSSSIKERFKALLKDNLANDLNYKTTMIGPHRDDFIVVFEGKDIRSFGSQGQQRVAAICLRLCELEMLKNKLNKKPVLLLDDVLSELDRGRERLLLEAINKKFQTFITTAGQDIFEREASGSIEKFNIDDNKVKKAF